MNRQRVIRTALTFTLVIGAVQAAPRDQSPPVRPPERAINGLEGTSRQALNEAGYRYDDPQSLIAALRQPDVHIAGIAAIYLGRLPRTPESVAALLEAADSGDEGLAVIAMKSLASLRASGWENAAIERLPQMQVLSTLGFGPLQIELASALAQAGRGDGWPIIQKVLAKDEFVYSVVDFAIPFHGLKDPDGKVIDAAGEIGKAIERAQATIGPDKMLILENRLRQMAGKPYLPVERPPRGSGSGPAGIR